MPADTAGAVRAFVTVGSRQVHYRRAGGGPPVVLLHELPRSSASLERLAGTLAKRFCVLAPDLPGYGLSDPLEGGEPSVERYADTLAGWLDVLRVERCGLYGAGTGAIVALDLARRRPERVAACILDGLPIAAAAEPAELLERSVPLEPRIDGGHLVALWTAYRDRFLFSPWYRHEREARLDVDLPSAEELHEAVVDILRAGAGYAAGEAAALTYPVRAALSELSVPTTVRLRRGDEPGALPPSVSLEPLDGNRGSAARLIASALAACPPTGTAPACPPVSPLAARIWRDYAATRWGRLLVRRAGQPGRGTPLVMLHASPGSAEMLVDLIRELAATREVAALDTLGNGDSDKPPWEAAEIADYAPVIAEAARALGFERFDLYGSHTGALIALETALLVPERVRRLVLDGVALFGPEESRDLLDHYTPPLAPADDGSQLVFAWNFLRDQTLFWPWYNRTRAGIRRVDPVGADALHVWLVELLKSGRTYPIAYRAAFSHRTRDRLPGLTTPALLVARRTDMLHASTFEAATLAAAARALTLPDDEHDAATAIAAFLDAAG